MTALILSAAALDHAAALVQDRGHHPAGIAQQTPPSIDIYWLWVCPLSGLAALYATTDGERALDSRPRSVPDYIDRAIDAWSLQLKADGVAPVLDLDGFVDHVATCAAWEKSATQEQVVASLRAAAQTLKTRAEGSRQADVTAPEGAAA